MSTRMANAYKTRLICLLADKESEIVDAKECNAQGSYIRLKIEEKKALKYAINLVDKELLEQGEET